MYTVWQAHRLRDFQHAPKAGALFSMVTNDQAVTKYELADGMRYAIEMNQLQVDKKASFVTAGERLLLFEAGWIALIISWQLVK